MLLRRQGERKLATVFASRCGEVVVGREMRQERCARQLLTLLGRERGKVTKIDRYQRLRHGPYEATLAAGLGNDARILYPNCTTVGRVARHVQGIIPLELLGGRTTIDDR